MITMSGSGDASTSAMRRYSVSDCWTGLAMYSCADLYPSSSIPSMAALIGMVAARRYCLPDQIGLAVVFIIDRLPFLCSHKEKAQDLVGAWALPGINHQN